MGCLLTADSGKCSSQPCFPEMRAWAVLNTKSSFSTIGNTTVSHTHPECRCQTPCEHGRAENPPRCSYYWVTFECHFYKFPDGSAGKESACNVRDLVSVLGLGRSLGEGHGNPFHSSCLKNSIDRGAWLAPVRGVPKSWTRLSLTPMLIAALFTIAKIRKKSKHLSTDQWIKMWYIYTQLNSTQP